MVLSLKCIQIGSSQSTSQDLISTGTCLLRGRSPGSDIIIISDVRLSQRRRPTSQIKANVEDLFSWRGMAKKSNLKFQSRYESKAQDHDHSSIVSLCLNFLPARSAVRNINWFPYKSSWMFRMSRTVCIISVVSD